MNELKNFNFNNLPVRTVLIDDEPWFVGKDVADILEYSDTQAMTRRLDAEDIQSYTDKSSGQGRQIKIINESGLYEAIIGSKKKEVKPFKRWITHEVLPTIRKHGAYMTDAKLEEVLLNPDTLISLATQLKEERQARLGLEKENSQLNLELSEANKKLPFLEWALQTKGLVTPTIIAKKYGKTAIWLNDWLHKQGIQFKQGKCWVLYKKYDDKGYSDTIFSPTDIDHLHPSMKWTVKGMKFIYELLKENGYLPISERDEDGKAS